MTSPIPTADSIAIIEHSPYPTAEPTEERTPNPSPTEEPQGIERPLSIVPTAPSQTLVTRFEVVPLRGPVAELSFAKYREVLFTPYCAQCHDPNAVHFSGVDLSVYPGVVSWITEIDKDVLVFGVMPPERQPAVPEEVKDFLRQWIEAGVPETPEISLASMSVLSLNPFWDPFPPPALEATFASIKTNIFQPLCMDCHSTGGRAGDLPLNTLAALRGIEPSIINLDDPASSSLVRRLRGQGGRIMPPPSSGRTPLTSAQINVVIQWIEAGLPAR